SVGRLRTISYEHERVSNMLRAAKNEVLQAEREAEAAKTKAKFRTSKRYHIAQTSHNRTAAQLAQTTSANAALRAASAADLRKREQDVARLKERWQKLAGEQAKLGTVGAGWGEGEEAAEGAMRDAIEARERLAEVPNIKLPTPAALFTPPAIEDDAGPALNAYRTLRDLIQQLASAGSTHSPDKEIAAREAERAKAEKHRLEIREWEDKVEKVEREVARLKGELAASNDFCEKSRVLIQQMVNDKKALEKDVEDRDSYVRRCLSALLYAPNPQMSDRSEAATIAEQRQQLEDERAKFTDAAIRLARERSDFEVERLALAEEKREWATRQLEDLPRVATSEPNPKRPVPVVVVVSDSGSSPVPMHVSQEPCLQPIVEDEEDLQSEPPRELELEPEPEPVERNGLADNCVWRLKCKAAEAGERPKKRGKAAASTAAGKKEKEKEKSRVKVKEKSADKAKAKTKEKAGAGSEEKETLRRAQVQILALVLVPIRRDRCTLPPNARAHETMRPLYRRLSRIISLAVSPGEKQVEEVVQLPSKMTMTLRSSANGRGARSPQNKSPKSSGSRSPKSGLAVGKSPKTGQGGAGTETGGGGKSTKTSVQSDVQSPLQAGSGSGSVVVGSLAEKFAAAAAKDRSKGKAKGADAEEGEDEGESEADSAGKSNSATTERSRTEQEKEKEDGRDLDVIFAAPKAKEKTTAAGSSRAGKSRVPVAAGKPTRVPVVAKRALMTPRKAAVGECGQSEARGRDKISHLPPLSSPTGWTKHLAVDWTWSVLTAAHEMASSQATTSSPHPPHTAGPSTASSSTTSPTGTHSTVATTIGNRHRSWDEDKHLHLYILDYCRRRKFAETASAFEREARISPDSRPNFDAPQGLLFEWWIVFWETFNSQRSHLVPPGQGESGPVYVNVRRLFVYPSLY
ncbi:Afadin- and alpha -actinin-Binding, partial [Rhizoctonia solani]